MNVKSENVIDFCPECGIGLNYKEKLLKFCRNCGSTWVDDNSASAKAKKTGRPPGSKNKPDHKAGAKKKEPTKRMSIPVSKVDEVRAIIKPRKVHLWFEYKNGTIQDLGNVEYKGNLPF